jgi:hypothetical protein
MNDNQPGVAKFFLRICEINGDDNFGEPTLTTTTTMTKTTTTTYTTAATTTYTTAALLQ